MELKVGDLVRTIDRNPTRNGMLGYIIGLNDTYVKVALNSSYHNIAHSIYYPIKDIKLVYQLEFDL